MRKLTVTTRKKFLDASAPAAGAEAPVFQITSAKLDRQRDRVLGVKAEGPELLLPLLWSHNSWEPAIGTARCYQEGGVWMMEPIFDEVDQRSRDIAAKVKAGTIRACSIGFDPADGCEPVPNTEGGLDYPLVVVLEVSLCNVGANEDALRVRAAPGASGSGDAALAAVISSLATTQAALTVAITKMAATKADDEPTEEPPADDGDAGEPDELTPESFAAGLLANLKAGAKLTADFLADSESLVGGEYDLLVWVAEGAKASLDQSISDLEGYLSGDEVDLPADGEEAAASKGEPEGDESEDDAETKDGDAADESEDDELPDEEAASEGEEDAPDEEEAKALRLRVRKHFGFSVAQAAALSVRELREYAALAA